MTLKRRNDLALLVTLHLDHPDVSVGAAHRNISGVPIKRDALSDGVSGVYLHDLLHHANIPGLEEAVRVAGGDVVAANRENCVLDRVQVAVEGLDGEASAHVPD